MKLLHGFGVNPDRKYAATTKQYQLWSDMVRRCYSVKDHINPRFRNYAECTIVSDWSDCTKFGDWASQQKGFGLTGFCLDKDILFSGNKVYSPQTCCFVPREVNMCFTFRNSDRGDHPLGITSVSLDKHGAVSSYGVCIKRGSLKKVNKSFKTIEEAVEFYKVEKESYVKHLAEKHKDVLDCRVYESLLGFRI